MRKNGSCTVNSDYKEYYSYFWQAVVKIDTGNAIKLFTLVNEIKTV